MQLTTWMNNAITSLALLTQGSLTHRRNQGEGLAIGHWFASASAVTGLDQGCNAELRAATLENVLARLA